MNDASQLSNMYSIVENVSCFHHVDLKAALIVKSGLCRCRPALLAGHKGRMSCRYDWSLWHRECLLERDYMTIIM